MYSSTQDPYRTQPTGRDAKLAGYAPLSGKSKPPKLTRRDRRDLLEKLSGFPVFAGCSQDDLEALIKVSEACSLPAGWAMIAQGTPADFCYIILRGSAGIYRGNERIAELGAGVLVGEMAVLSGDLRTATVTTMTRVSTLAVANSVMDQLLRKRPTLNQAVRRQALERTAAPAAEA